MPQLDIQTYSSQIFWLVISFFTMYFIMAKIIVPRLNDIAQKRRDNIEGNLSSAENFKKQAESFLNTYEKAMEEANKKAEASLEKTKKDLFDFINEKQNDQALKLQQKIRLGEKEIEENHTKVLLQVKEMSVDLGIVITKKLGLKNISKNDIIEALDSMEIK